MASNYFFIADHRQPCTFKHVNARFGPLHSLYTSDRPPPNHHRHTILWQSGVGLHIISLLVLTTGSQCKFSRIGVMCSHLRDEDVCCNILYELMTPDGRLVWIWTEFIITNNPQITDCSSWNDNMTVDVDVVYITRNTYVEHWKH